MHDAGAAHTRQFGIAEQKAVQQRAVPVACGRMHNQSGRLIDDDNVFVFIKHFEIDAVFGLIRRVFRRRLRSDDQFIAVGHFHANTRGRFAVDEHRPGFDPFLKTGAAHRGNQDSQNLVKTFPYRKTFNFIDIGLCCIIHIIFRFKRLDGLFADIIAQLIFRLLFRGHEFQ